MRRLDREQHEMRALVAGRDFVLPDDVKLVAQPVLAHRLRDRLHLRAVEVLLRVSHDSRYVSHTLWAQSVSLLGSIGRQGGGWLKSAVSNKAPAA